MTGNSNVKGRSVVGVLQAREDSLQRRKSGRWVDRYGTLAVLILLIILAAFLSPTFLAPRNLLNVGRQVALNGFLSIGMTLTILTGGIDLSVGPNMALAGVLVAKFTTWGIGAVGVALLAGALIGLINGSIVAFLRIHPFIVTLGMLTIVRGVALVVSGGHPIEGTPEFLYTVARGRVGGIPIQGIIFLFVIVLVYIFLKRIYIGTHIYAVGSSEEAARLSGVNVYGIKILVYVLSGILAALAGVIAAGNLNVGDPQFGLGAELAAIAASVIGGIYLMGGRGSILGTVLGVLVIGIIRNLLNLMNVPGDIQWIFTGVIIVIAVAVQRFRE